MSERVLVIEDDTKVARALGEGLRGEGYHVVIETSGTDGMQRACAELFDVIILDRCLPLVDGIDIVRTMRSHGARTPVIMVTAKDSVEDRVQGLDAGADDYLVKPFAFPELVARIRAVVRQERPVTGADVTLSIADLEMDLLARTVTRAGRVVDLTAKEFQLLAYLVHHAGMTVARDTLAEQAWGGFERNLWLDNAIDVHVSRIRKKVDDDHSVRLIHTIRGLGFVVSTTPPSRQSAPYDIPPRPS